MQTQNNSHLMPAIRERREALGWTALELATAAQVSPSFLGSVERGYRPRRSAAVGRIDHALRHAELAEVDVDA